MRCRRLECLATFRWSKDIQRSQQRERKRSGLQGLFKRLKENPNTSKENANPPKPEIPPTWLSVVGHRQFMARLPTSMKTLRKEDGKDGKYFGPTDEEPLLAGEVNSGNRWGKTGLPLEMWSLLFGCLILAVWHWYCCANGSIHRSPKLLAYFAPVPRMQHTVLIFIGSLILAFLSLVLWLSIFGGCRDGASHANCDGDERYRTGDLFFRLSRSCGQLPPTARLG
jgi:hypothetical protein